MTSLDTLVQKIESVYPRALAGSWDNTGLLLEPALPRHEVSAAVSRSTGQSSLQETQDRQEKEVKQKVLLCIDLTTRVCDEALSDAAISLVIAYHPIVFRGLKRLTLEDTQQRSLLRLAQAGVAVHCPHTAVDAVRGGVNDDLVDVCLGKVKPHAPVNVDDPPPSARASASSTSTSNSNTGRAAGAKAEAEASELVKEAEVVESPPAKVQGFENAGYGRVFTLERPISAKTLVQRVKVGLGLGRVGVVSPRNLQPADTAAAAVAEGGDGDEKNIYIIAVCAGSGATVLKPLLSRAPRPCPTAASDAGAEASSEVTAYRPDYILTGELSHHDALAFAESGVGCILAGHSNTERPFLTRGMQPLLTRLFNSREQCDEDAEGERAAKAESGAAADAADAVEVVVSATDSDPILFV